MNIQRPKDDQNFWSFLLSLFFLLVLIAAMWEIFGEQHNFPRSVPLFDALLMVLAAFRITRLVVYDKITRWFRELFVSNREFTKDGVAYVEMRPVGSGFRNTIHDLLGCPWCIGFWSSIIICFCYFVFPWMWFVIFFLAVAGAGSFVQILANLIGWKAENLKLDAQEKERRL
ncbi:MAG TPA: DUF1360 domain-containing protein [Candidatus Paceibacterota bacterium]